MRSAGIRKILVVDDEESMCRLLTVFMEMNGYRCQSATDPLKALEMLKSDDFDLVITDIRMDGMDGLDLTREIRKTFPAVDTIVMSAFTGDYAYSNIIEAGAADFIGKPLSLTELKAKIGRVDREHKMVAELREANEAINCTLADMERANQQLVHEIDERKRTQKELYNAHKEIESLMSSIPLIMIEVSNDGIIKRWNTVAEKVLQIDSFEAHGMEISKCPIPWDSQKIDECLRMCSSESIASELKSVRFTRKNGEDGLLDLTISPIKENLLVHSGIIILGTDTTEHVLLERQLAQSQKLESIGRLAAGIAHEINTPAQYVGDNTRFLEEAYGDLERIHDLYHQLIEHLKSEGLATGLVQKIEETSSEVDLEYVRDQTPKAIRQSLEGIERITKIVRAMKEFSHPGTDAKKEIDLNKAIESTITVARNEWKYVAEMVTDFDLSMPPVACLPGEFNQAILNIIINAAHSIAEKNGNEAGQKGTISISTRGLGDFVEILISDTGMGIAENIRSKIFDPFFTTKEVGQGTGQGLAISHSVIVEKHGGTIDFETEAGKGTTFIIRLPVQNLNAQEAPQ